MTERAPFFPRSATGGLVCAADQLASLAGVQMLDRGGTAADAAVAAGAVMGVVAPQTCGLGGDMLAMVQPPGSTPEALLGVGRAGSGADAGVLRSEGRQDMPFRGDVRAVPIPGAVDGWLALHDRYGRLPLGQVLEPAIALATEGFTTSALLSLASHLVAGLPGTAELCPEGPLETGSVVRLPGVARTLRAMVHSGREGVYLGEMGAALLELGHDEYRPGDFQTPLAEWVEPLRLEAFGHLLWTVPPPSQGYLTLAGAWIAQQLGIPSDPADPEFPVTVARASAAAGRDRPQVLWDGADGAALLDRARLTRQLERHGRAPLAAPDGGREKPASSAGHASPERLSDDGDTTHLCVVDAQGMAVSLTQSNALDFGSHLVAGRSGVFLHNRGLGFSIVAGHPNEYGPGRRPAHTLSPAMVTEPDGTLSHVLGTMGGDSQPQILLQLLVRLLHARQDPATAIASSRVVLETTGRPPFRLWDGDDFGLVVEDHAPSSWVPALTAHGERVQVVGAYNPVDVGCSQIIAVERRGGRLVQVGASDPRSPEGAAVGR